MPLRAWFTERGHPGWYSWIVVVGTSLASSVLVLVVTLHLARASVERERQARIQASEEGRRTACVLIVAQDNAFTDSKPATEAGAAAAKAWRQLRVQFKCDERK